MTTTQLSSGLYRIAVARASGGIAGGLLTRQGKDRVTILPPSAKPDPDQEWRITHGQEGNIIISTPSPIFPSSYLTYKGAPDKPKENDRVEYHVAEFPPNEWHTTIAPGFAYLLRVAGSELGIKLGPELIEPPFLVLGLHDLLEWRFELVANE